MEKKVAILGATALMEMALNSPEKLSELGVFRVMADEEVNKNDFFKPEPTMIIKNYNENLMMPFIDPPISPNQKKFRKKNNRKHKSKMK